MGVNLDKPDKWKQDIKKSVDMYNDWFMNFAPEAFRSTRSKTTNDVLNTIKKTNFYRNINSELLSSSPEILSTLRMSTCPPIAIDRLIGLSGVNPNLVKQIENNKRLPARMSKSQIDNELSKICTIILKLLDKDIFPWLCNNSNKVDEIEVHRASTIIADRLCGSIANPIIRNAQEKRQLELIKKWLEKHGYKQLPENEKRTFDNITAGTFVFHFNIQVKMDISIGYVNIPVDIVIKPLNNKKPVLIEAKSAGDFTNVNKRRKEEAQKMSQLHNTYGNNINFILFLCGYFDTGYLGYEAAEGIDWIWEHSINDLEYFLS